MAKLDPMVIICFPETHKESIDFHFALLPKWIRLYILRWWERRQKEKQRRDRLKGKV